MILSTTDAITNAIISYQNGEHMGTINTIEYQHINISCKAEDNDPEGSLEVTINGYPVVATTTSAQNDDVVRDGMRNRWILFQPMFREHQGAVFECIARNRAKPDGIEAAVELNVMGK